MAVVLHELKLHFWKTSHYIARAQRCLIENSISERYIGRVYALFMRSRYTRRRPKAVITRSTDRVEIRRIFFFV